MNYEIPFNGKHIFNCKKDYFKKNLCEFDGCKCKHNKTLLPVANSIDNNDNGEPMQVCYDCYYRYTNGVRFGSVYNKDVPIVGIKK